LGAERHSVSSEETGQFAAALARNLEPVRRIPRLRLVAAGLSLWALLVAGVAVALLGPRADVRALQMNLPFVGIVSALLVFGVSGLLASLGSSVPGRDALSRIGLAGVWMALVILVLAGAGLIATDTPFGPFDSTWLGMSLSCLGIATGAGFLPAVALLAFILGAFPYRPRLAVGLGAAGMVAFGSGAVHLTCASDEFLHVSLAHVLAPLAAGGLFGISVLYAQTRRSAHR